MPTPFTHLATIAEMLAHPDLPAPLAATLTAEAPAFALGNIAPDVQTLSGQSREATHFFPVPLNPGPPAALRLLAAHPALARPVALPPAQAAFLAGYFAHLVFDELWIAHLFTPYFGPAQTWGADFRERLYFHNVLRSVWDAADRARLTAPAGPMLAAAAPAGWLPFETDHYLAAWRDWVADQLRPGAPSRTVEVFTTRMQVDPAAFTALLADPAELEHRLYAHVPPAALDRYRAAALAASVRLLRAYYAGEVGGFTLPELNALGPITKP
jgi:hypothetical protein